MITDLVRLWVFVPLWQDPLFSAAYQELPCGVLFPFSEDRLERPRGARELVWEAWVRAGLAIDASSSTAPSSPSMRSNGCRRCSLRLLLATTTYPGVSYPGFHTSLCDRCDLLLRQTRSDQTSRLSPTVRGRSGRDRKGEAG